jgi:hypothetical protein
MFRARCVPNMYLSVENGWVGNVARVSVFFSKPLML